MESIGYIVEICKLLLVNSDKFIEIGNSKQKNRL